LVSIPVMMLTFLLTWLFVGKISLMPVEDLLIDECQKRVWGEVRLRGLSFGPARFTREIVYSGLVALAGLFFFLLSFI
ncbi:hypothetical protein, partial [Staphylococcus aureus]|uniref:hypothetical protein n=1 Tax=Staphylococcus aureus TaxID=1280 RepID=UPI001ED98CD1